MNTIRKLLVVVIGVAAVWGGSAGVAEEMSDRARTFHDRLGQLNREQDYLEMEAWAFEKDPGDGPKERRVREAVWVLTDPGKNYDREKEIWADRFLGRLEKECGGQWWAWFETGELLSRLKGNGEMVDGSFRRTGSGRYRPEGADMARARQAFLKAMGMTQKPEELAAIQVRFADVFDLGPGVDVSLLTDLSVVPEITDRWDPGRWGWGAEKFVVDGRSPVIGEDGGWRLPVLRARFEDASTDYERVLWLLSEAKRLSPEHAPKAKLILAQMWHELLGVRNLGPAGYIYIEGTETAADLQAKGEFELHTLKDEETFVIGPKGVERRTIPEGSRYVTMLRELVGSATTPDEVWSEAVMDLLEALADRCQFDQVEEVAKQALKRDPGHEGAKEMIVAIGPDARFLEGDSFVAGDDVTVEFLSREIGQQRFELWKLDVQKYAKEDGGQTLRLDGAGALEMDAKNFAEIRQFFTRAREWTVPIPKRGNHMQSVSPIRVPVSEAGYYMVTAKVGDNWKALHVQVSRTAILSVGLERGHESDPFDGSGGDTNLFLIDAVSGKPVEGATATAVRGGGEAVSDHTGYLLGLSAREGVLVQRVGGPVEILWVPGAILETMDEEEVRSLLVTNQPLYRPGQKVDYAGWLRRPNWRQASSGNFEKGTRVKVKVIDPAGQVIHEAELPLDEFGGFQGGFNLSTEMVLGDCTVDLWYSENLFSTGEADDDRWVTLRKNSWDRTWSIRVGEFRKPDFQVEVNTDGGQGRDELSATVRATYLSGEPVKGAAVKARLTASPRQIELRPRAEWENLYGEGYDWSLPDAKWCKDWKAWGIRRNLYHEEDDDDFPWNYEILLETTGVTDSDGNVKLVFAKDLPYLDSFDYGCSVRVGVQEFTGRSVGAESVFYHTKRKNEVFARPAKGFYRPGEAVRVNLWTLSAENEPVAGTGTFVVEAIEGKDGFKQIAAFDVTTDAKGISEVEFTPPGAGRYRCMFESGGGRRGFVLHVIGDGAGPIDGIELIPVKSVGAPGEELEVLVLTEDAEALVWFFEQMPDGRRRSPRMIGTREHMAVVKIPLSAAGVPNFFLTAGTVTKGHVKTTGCRIVIPPVDKKLIVAMDLMPGKREPGERTEVEIGVTDAAGKSAEVSLAVTAYDRALEDLSDRQRKAGSTMLDEFYEVEGPYSSQDGGWRDKSAFAELYQPGCFFERGDLLGDPRRQATSRFERIGLNLWVGYEPPELPNSIGRPDTFAAFPMTPGMTGLYTRLRGQEVALSEEEKAGVKGIKLRKNFTDRAFWGAALKTDDHGKVKVAFDLPDNPTSWRLQSWAFGKGRQYGDADLEIPVSKSLLLRPLLPQAAVAGDAIEVGAMVANSTDRELEIHVTMEAGKVAQPARKVTLAAKEEAHVRWDVKLDQVGALPFRFRARSADGTLSDGAEIPLPVGPRLAPVTVSAQAELKPDETEARAVMAIDEAVPAGSSIEVRVEANPAASALAVLPDLVAYPYGCTEQTMNRFLPTLVAWQAADKLGLDWKSMRQILMDHDPSLGWARGRGGLVTKPVDLSEDKVRDMIHVGLARLAELQGDGGAWGWFSPEDAESAAYMTALAVRGLATAKKLGFKREDNKGRRDPAEIGTSWLRDWSIRRATVLSADPGKVEALDAWVAYVLSVAGENGQAEFMKALLAGEKGLPLTGQIHLALALDPVVAKADFNRLLETVRRRMAEERKGGHAWWEELVEQRAWYLKLLVKAGSGDDEIQREIQRLLDERSDGIRWSSTKNSALCIEAIIEAALASRNAGFIGGEDIEVKVRAANEERVVTLGAANLWRARLDLPLTEAIGEGASYPVVASRRGNKPVQLSTSLSYDSALPARMGAIDRGMRVERQYFRVDASGKKSRLGDGEKLRVGELVEVKLKVSGNAPMNHVHLRDPLPAGLEPLVPLSGYQWGAYRENRTGESHFFISQLSGWNEEQSYYLRAVTRGKAVALPARAECMYLPEVFGQDAMRVIEIE